MKKHVENETRLLEWFSSVDFILQLEEWKLTLEFVSLEFQYYELVRINKLFIQTDMIIFSQF